MTGTGRPSLPAWLRAAALYAAGLFLVGMVLGIVREFFVKPRVGGVGAVMIEAPLMIGAMLLLAPLAMRRAGLAPILVARTAMGAAALAILLTIELAGARLLRGWSFEDWLRHATTVEGAIGLCLYVVFASVPLLLRRTSPERNE